MSEEAVIKYINAPLTEETVKDLHAGDVVRISGYIYTARDAAHKRLYEALERGEKLPLDLTNNVIYYVGPTPAKPGEVVGSAGPTTSGRMDKYTPTMIEQGMLLERLGITARAQALARHLSDAALDAHVAAHRRLTHPEEMGRLFKAMAIHPKGSAPPPGFD